MSVSPVSVIIVLTRAAYDPFKQHKVYGAEPGSNGRNKSQKHSLALFVTSRFGVVSSQIGGGAPKVNKPSLGPDVSNVARASISHRVLPHPTPAVFSLSIRPGFDFLAHGIATRRIERREAAIEHDLFGIHFVAKMLRQMYGHVLDVHISSTQKLTLNSQKTP